MRPGAREIVCAAAVSLIGLPMGCAGGAARESAAPRCNHDRADPETVFDRRPAAQRELVLEIPQVPRWCTVLGLQPRAAAIDGGELYYESEGAGRPLVLVHGGPGATHHYFHPAFSNAARFARVIYYDQRGCGQSSYSPGAGYTVEQAVDDLDRLRAELGIDRWVVLGHSYGGLVAQRYAMTYPEHLAGLILVCAEPGFEGETGPGREDEILCATERERIQAIHARNDLTMAQRVYNAQRNGDWRRQDYYKPSAEKFARIALYEWCHDSTFRQQVHEADRRGTKGAFDGCPIPTLIIESTWDLTWGRAKPAIMQANHPAARLVILQASGHSPFDDEPVPFFRVLREFLSGLTEPAPAAVAVWQARVAARPVWHPTTPGDLQHNFTFGWAESREIASAYSPAWLAELTDPRALLRLGLALYDMERYEEALAPFERLHDVAGEQPLYQAIALVWQGHMLDLLGRREEAIQVYKRVVAMNVTDRMQHGQYELVISPSPYAGERLQTPFKRCENRAERP